MAEDTTAAMNTSWPLLLFLKALFGGKQHNHLFLLGIVLNPFALEKGITPGWISLLLSLVIDTER